MGYPCYFGPFLGLGFVGGNDLPLLSYVFAFSVPLSLIICKIRLRGLGGKRSRRLGLDGHLGHNAFYMRLKKLKKACLSLAL